MQFDSFEAFLNMGGYGFYVWLSYGFATVVMSLLIFASLRAHKQTKINIAKRSQREAKLRRAAKQHAAQQEISDSNEA